MRRTYRDLVAASIGFWVAVAIESTYHHVLNAPIRHGRLHP